MCFKMYKLLLWVVVFYIIFVVVSAEVSSNLESASNITSSEKNTNTSIDDLEGRRRKHGRIWCKFFKF